jgi:hypothetical protein
MTRYLLITGLLGALGVGSAAGQVPPASPSDADLPEIGISQPVTANGKLLAPGTYRIRITGERPALPTGEPSESQRWVEFIANGAVAGREIAEVIPVDDVPAGATAPKSAPRAVVQLLKEGDFVRVSLWDSGARYLVYLSTGSAPKP